MKERIIDNIDSNMRCLSPERTSKSTLSATKAEHAVNLNVYWIRKFRSSHPQRIGVIMCVHSRSQILLLYRLTFGWTRFELHMAVDKSQYRMASPLERYASASEL